MPVEADDLVVKMSAAHDLMHRIVNLQNEVNAQTNRLAARRQSAKAKGSKRYTLLGLFISLNLCWFVTFYIFSRVYVASGVGPDGITAMLGNFLLVYLIVSVVAAYPIGRFVKKLFDRRSVTKNLALEQRNGFAPATDEEILQGIEQTKAAIMQAQRRWAAEIAPWYPMDYDSLSAVDFFCVALRNGRAQTLRDLINLYEVDAHHRRMEAGQQQMLTQQQQMLAQQRVGTMLQVGNLFMQGQILSQAQSINSNTGYVAAAMGKQN